MFENSSQPVPPALPPAGAGAENEARGLTLYIHAAASAGTEHSLKFLPTNRREGLWKWQPFNLCSFNTITF